MSAHITAGSCDKVAKHAIKPEQNIGSRYCGYFLRQELVPFDFSIHRLVFCSDCNVTSTRLNALPLYSELKALSDKGMLKVAMCLQLTSVLDRLTYAETLRQQASVRQLNCFASDKQANMCFKSEPKSEQYLLTWKQRSTARRLNAGLTCGPVCRNRAYTNRSLTGQHHGALLSAAESSYQKCPLQQLRSVPFSEK